MPLVLPRLLLLRLMMLLPPPLLLPMLPPPEGSRVLRVLRVLLRRGRGWPVVEAGRGDCTQAELREIAHALGVRRCERLRNAP